MKLVDLEKFFEQQETKESSTQQFAQEALLRMGVSTEVSGNFPESGPVLLVSNHPAPIDSFVMLSAVQRSDFRQVALADHMKMSPVLSEITFPIFRKKLMSDALRQLFVKGLDEHILEDEQHIKDKNRSSIADAAGFVSTGGAVVIYPTGTGGSKPLQGKWKAGVGYLAQQIIHPETKIVFAKIEGTHEIDILRFSNPKVRKFLLQPKQVVVTFSEPILLNQVVNQHISGKEASYLLENAYSNVFP